VNNQKLSIAVSLMLGGIYGLQVYADEKAIQAALIASIYITLLSLVIFRVLIRLTTTQQQPKENLVREKSEDTNRKKVTRINPQYYSPGVALNRFAPSSDTVVIGVGCAGINTLNHLLSSDLMHDMDSVAIDTDLQKIHSSTADCSIFIGDQKDRVAELVDNSMGQLVLAFRHAENVVVFAGLGGKTGTIAAPMISKEAKRAGAAVHFAAIEPFLAEGRPKLSSSLDTLNQLKGKLDSVISLSNEDLNRVFSPDEKFAHSLSAGHEALSRVVATLKSPVTIH